jgi:RNA polymerase sigma-70 factor (ECF subfamily)
MTEAERAREVAAAAQGDADALQRLLIEYHAPLQRRVVERLDPSLASRLEAEDVLQEAYVAAFAALQRSADRAPPPVGETGRLGDRDPEVPAGRPQTPASQGPPPCRFDSPAAFYRWLEQIVLNKLRDAERAARRWKRDVARDAGCPVGPATSYPDLLARVTGTGTTPSGAMSRQEAVAAIVTCLARLPPDYRQVVRLRFLEEVPVSEVAARLGKSEMAVYQQCHRALKALRELLESTRR